MRVLRQGLRWGWHGEACVTCFEACVTCVEVGVAWFEVGVT